MSSTGTYQVLVCSSQSPWLEQPQQPAAEYVFHQYTQECSLASGLCELSCIWYEGSLNPSTPMKARTKENLKFYFKFRGDQPS